MKPTYNIQQPAQGNQPVMTRSEPLPGERSSHVSGWILFPLRIFLGITFVYAGIQKLTDPQFFHSTSPGSIGNQIMAFAHGSPLHDFLLTYALPNAMLFGWAVAFGEIAIGLGTLFGFLFRPATFFGMLLSILFLLTASWHVYPYFYGADIVFAFCWLTMLLNGPLNTGLPSLDGWMVKHLLLGNTAKPSLGNARLIAAFLVATPGASLPVTTNNQNIGHGQRQSILQRAQETRRNFLIGALSGGGIAALGVSALGYALRLIGGNEANNALPAQGSVPTAIPTPADDGTFTTATPVPTASSTLARVSAVPKNSAITFTLPSTGDAGVLIHLSDDQFVAFDATCTHAGCTVDFDPVSSHLICPCHGAEYDPTKSAQVLQGPARSPLASVAIHIDSATGVIMLQN